MAWDEPIDLSRLTLRQLEELRKRAGEEIAKKREETARWLKEIRDRQIVERGIRYRNPSNPSETWSGKGPRPRWVREALANGMTLEDLEASDALPAPREDG